MKYVRTSADWLYLAPVIGLCSRRKVGYAVSTEQDSRLSVAALVSALEARGNSRNALVRSDRGRIFGDDERGKKANTHRLRRSMSRTRKSRDNAEIESFLSPIKHGLACQIRKWRT